MLREIDLSEIHCFEVDQKLQDLTPNNFVFAPNGSGKTSITRFLTSRASHQGSLVWEHAAPITLRIFNSDFQRKAFASSELEGVFLLGSDSIELEEALIKARDERTRQNENLNKNKDILNKKKSELDTRKNQLGKTLKDIKNSIPLTHTEPWVGSKRIDSLLKNSLKAFSGNSITPNWSALEKQAALLFDDTAKEFYIPQRPDLQPSLFDNLPSLLAKPLVSASELPLSKLISNFEISDWVSEGQAHRAKMQKHEDDRCPFCQQRLPVGFDESLTALFDQEYEYNKELIVTAQVELTQFADSLKEFLDDHNDQFIQADENGVYLQRRAEFERRIEEVKAKVAQKIQEPSQKVTMPELKPTVLNFSATLDDLFKEMDQHNKTLKNKAKERASWLNQVWNAFANGSAFDTLNNFKEDNKNLEKAISGLEKKVKQAEIFVKNSEQKIRKLEAQTVSSESTIIKINSILEKCQFHSFRLAKSKQKEDGYTVIRNDGSAIDPLTLSEGKEPLLLFSTTISRSLQCDNQMKLKN